MSTDSPERPRDPGEHDDEPRLTVSQAESAVHETSRRRSSEVPDGDSVLLRLARFLGLR